MNQSAMPPLFSRPLNLLAALGVPALALALAACSPQGSETNEEPPLAGAPIGGDFELINSKGETVRWADFRGKWTIVYFGYAYCPDICPTDMQRTIQGLKLFGQEDAERAASIQPIFISVDPERDTPDVVGQFTSAFSDQLIGLTGTPEQVKQAGDAFRVYYNRGEDTAGGGYLVDHTNITYLFDPDGKPIATLPTDQGPEAIAAELDKWVS
ncbi:MAG: SCO family protein [Sphingomonadaceae bacterium]|nr:SCO family protein [Sphingomonadaceae bacterium]